MITATQAGDRRGAYTATAGDLVSVDGTPLLPSKALADQAVSRVAAIAAIAAANRALQQVTRVRDVFVALGVAASPAIALEEGVALDWRMLTQVGAITQHVEAAREAMGEIAAGSEQQAVGLHRISAAVEQIDRVTQRVAANAEESSATSVELSSQARQLQELVHAFRLAGTDGDGSRGHARDGGTRGSALEPAVLRGGGRAPGRARGVLQPAGR